MIDTCWLRVYAKVVRTCELFGLDWWFTGLRVGVPIGALSRHRLDLASRGEFLVE